MPVTEKETVPFSGLEFTTSDITAIRETCSHLLKHIVDRRNLPGRNDAEKLHNLIMGEVSEIAVLKYLQANQKYAQSAVNKKSNRPDLGHDIYLKSPEGNVLPGSIKSSCSYAYGWADILRCMHFPFTRGEVKDFNIRAYYRCPKDFYYHLDTIEKAVRDGRIMAFATRELLLAGHFVSYPKTPRRMSDVRLQDGLALREILDLLSH